MKYIKKFERNDGIFYDIPYSRDLFLIALDKIDTTEENKELIKISIRDGGLDISNFDGIYIGFYVNINNVKTYEYWAYSKNGHKRDIGYEAFKEHDKINYVYKGIIKLEKWEIDSKKYNI